MKKIDVTIRNKVATVADRNKYICGNSDFILNFDFDEEWAEFECKTARFVYNDTYTDVVFVGNQCGVPVISNTNVFFVGVYAGDIRTTTPALIEANKSILCGTNPPAQPAPDVYSQMVELFNAGLDESLKNANAAQNARAAAETARGEAVAASTESAVAASQSESSAQNAKASEESAKAAEQNAAKSAEEAKEAANKAGGVQSVNGKTPDENGNIEIEVGEGSVKTVNGVAPDEKGNVEIEAGGGVSSWNDLTDKPFGEEVGMVEVLAETTVMLTHQDGIDSKENSGLLGLVAGKQYKVVYNGEEYEYTAVDISGLGVGFGNLSGLGQESNGEPFGVADLPTYNSWFLMDYNGNSVMSENGTWSSVEATLSITAEATIHPIEGKYLPKGTPWIEEDGGMVEILPDYTINSEEDIAGIPRLGLVEGNTYVVKLMGMEFTCVAWKVPYPEAGTVTGLGDIYTASEGVFGTAATGEPFVLMELPPEVAAQVGMNVMVEPLVEVEFPIVFSVVGEGVAIHKLDSRCLPDGVPMLFNVNINPNDDGTFSADKPCAVIFGNGLNTNTIVRAILSSDDGYVMMSLAALTETGAVFSGSFRMEGMTLSYTVVVKQDDTVEVYTGMG